MGSFQEAVDNKDVYWNEEPYCSLLRKNLMTCKRLLIDLNRIYFKTKD